MVPNSALTQPRPLAVIAAKEDRDEVLRPLIPQIEQEITSVSNHGFNMQYMDKELHVTVHSSLTMFDDKMRAALQGTGGAFCQMCKISKPKCHCIDYVVNGFTVDRTIADMHSIFNFLTGSGEMAEVPRRKDDYDVRAGVTAEPITHRDLNAAIPVTHAWIRCASWYLNILYHVVGKDNTWGFGNKTDARFKKLMKAKEKIQGIFATPLGVKIDTVDSTGHSGNTLTAKIAKKFFSKKCRPLALLSPFVNNTQLQVIERLHINLEIILRVITSTHTKIDLENFQTLCTATYVDILTHLKWVDLTPTVHKVLAHAPELIEKNMSMGLGHLSEEGLEACNKIIRRFRVSWTLQLNDDANLKDLLRKMWLISDPLFYSFRRTVKCRKCGDKGHQRKCPVKQQVANVADESDTRLDMMFVD